MGALEVEVVGGLLVALIAGPIGYFVKGRFFTKSRYLPGPTLYKKENAYQNMSGPLHEYHLTYDPKTGKDPILVESIGTFRVEKNLIVVGNLTTQVEHRLKLRYELRGQINGGRLYYTAVCANDPSDVYCAMYQSLLDDIIQGMVIGWDYQKDSYASPILLSKKQLDGDEAEKILTQFTYKQFGHKEH